MTDVSLRESVLNARRQDVVELVEGIDAHNVRGDALYELLDNAVRHAEVRGQLMQVEQHFRPTTARSHTTAAMANPDSTLIGGSDFELQRVLPLAKALLESGMDIDTLLARMMGLE